MHSAGTAEGKSARLSARLPLGVTAGQRAGTRGRGVPHVQKHRRRLKPEGFAAAFPTPKNTESLPARFPQQTLEPAPREGSRGICLRPG